MKLHDGLQRPKILDYDTLVTRFLRGIVTSCYIIVKIRKPTQDWASTLYQILEGSTRFRDRSTVDLELFSGMCMIFLRLYYFIIIFE